MNNDPGKTVEYRERMNLLDMLALADHASDDGLGNTTYTFETAAASALLTHNIYDGDTSVTIRIAAQTSPIARFHLMACERIRVVNDERGKYLEFVGIFRTEEYAPRGGKKLGGFRLFLDPALCLEPFLRSDA